MRIEDAMAISDAELKCDWWTKGPVVNCISSVIEFETPLRVQNNTYTTTYVNSTNITTYVFWLGKELKKQVRERVEESKVRHDGGVRNSVSARGEQCATECVRRCSEHSSGGEAGDVK